MQGFSGAQAARLTGCSVHQVRYWSQIEFVTPSIGAEGDESACGAGRRAYSFGDLVALRIVKSLLDGGMTLKQVRKAFEFVSESADLNDRTSLAGAKLVTDGRTIFEICRTDGEILDALKRGQMALFVDVDDMERDVAEGVDAFLADRDQFVSALADAP
ncbi:MAG: hypothetical protein DCC49_10015 [Acidobacteria bacterium]|nr:MAG: hypothetical protein DCC49_10015 [Acidobacteriota bacterium]